jgi:hypothetical protein
MSLVKDVIGTLIRGVTATLFNTTQVRVASETLVRLVLTNAGQIDYLVTEPWSASFSNLLSERISRFSQITEAPVRSVLQSLVRLTDSQSRVRNPHQKDSPKVSSD